MPTPSRWKTLVAFSIIYFVWGSTFLAIRISVHQIPPLLCAALRFLIAEPPSLPLHALPQAAA